METPDDTGLTQGEDGVISIGPAASKASQKRAEKEAFENADKVMGEINAQTEAEADPDYISDGGAPGVLPKGTPD